MANFFTDASSVMTVISFVAFLGILWWTFGLKRSDDFDEASRLPFADEEDEIGLMVVHPAAHADAHAGEARHG
jgi:cytochrome c oxidase cbb3-type subunit 4